ncbi:MAG: phosphodiester glycosidase family protein, partial [Fimbriimonadaceae bacterium]
MVRLYRLLLGGFTFCLLYSECFGQVWEKLVVPGLTYRMELDSTLPRMIHVLRWSPNSSVTAKPELAGGTVFEPNATNGRETISEMAKRTSALAVINADFFPFGTQPSGDPLGLMVREGELLSLPYQNRSAFAWGKSKSFATGATSAQIQMKLGQGLPIPIPQYNEECKPESLCLNTPAAGIVKCIGSGTHAIIRVREGAFKLGSKITGEVEQVVSGQNITIPSGKCVLTGTGGSTGEVTKLKAGEIVEITLGVAPFDWTKLEHAVGGGPNLVTRGLVSIDAAAQSFNADFSEKRHPRTAVGRAADGDLLFVTIDGRQELSAGATMDELARVMQRLGCMDAINLDGGGSTTINILGLTLNRPSGGREREVANGICFYGKAPVVEQDGMTINGPTTMVPKTTTYLKVLDSTKMPIQNSEVLW